MKALKLVRGIPGAKGGYLPTELAYEILRFNQEVKEIPIYRNEKLSDVTLQELRVTSSPPFRKGLPASLTGLTIDIVLA